MATFRPTYRTDVRPKQGPQDDDDSSNDDRVKSRCEEPEAVMYDLWRHSEIGLRKRPSEERRSRITWCQPHTHAC